MKLVGDLLSRFNKLTPPNDSIRGAISDSLLNTLEIRCPKDRISISNGVAHIRTSSIKKSTIQINRAKVLEDLFERLPKAKDTVRDIR